MPTRDRVLVRHSEQYSSGYRCKIETRSARFDSAYGVTLPRVDYCISAFGKNRAQLLITQIYIFVMSCREKKKRKFIKVKERSNFAFNFIGRNATRRKNNGSTFLVGISRGRKARKLNHTNAHQ